MLEGRALAEARARAPTLRAVRVSSREKGDLDHARHRRLHAARRFHDARADWEGVCDRCRTAAGLFWPIPITLSVDAATAAAIRIGDDIALTDPDDGTVLALMTVTEQYRIDKARECESVFRTTDDEHPGVKMVMQQGDVNLAGPGARCCPTADSRRSTARCS